MVTEQTLYRVIFLQEDKIYEIYARYVSEESLIGFIEVEEFVFADEESLVVDPSEEKLRAEFKDVKRSYIPMHHLLRIDEVEKTGLSKIKAHEKQSNVHKFPGRFNRPTSDE